jgi:predicted DNA binding CopG/RHH family protein
MVNYIDDEEKELIESLHNDEWVSDFNEEEKLKYQQIAKNTIEQTKLVELKLPMKDYSQIQNKAFAEGMPVETYIAMLVHNHSQNYQVK